MPDPTKKKKVSASPEGKAKVFATKTVKSDPDNVLRKKRTSGEIKGVRTKAQQATEGDRRMQVARDKARKENVKEAGGVDKYLKGIKKSKEGLIKYKGKYVRKDGALGKKALAEKRKAK